MPKLFHEHEYQTLVVLNKGQELNEDMHDAIGIIAGEIPSTNAVLREREIPRCIFDQWLLRSTLTLEQEN